jgi:cardiolipin synthase
MLNLTQYEITLIGLAYALIELIGIVLAFHAVLHARSSQAAIAWAVSLIATPFFALPLYVLFGGRKLSGYIQARRSGDRAVKRHTLGVVRDRLLPFKTDPSGRSRLAQALESLSGMFFTRGNTLRLLIDGHDSFAAIFEAIENADEYILIQFFIIRDDRLGRKLQQALIEKSRQGVHCSLLYDGIGSFALPNSYVTKLQRSGVDVRVFRSHTGTFNRFQFNFRNHRKIVIVDGRVAFAGGHNVGVEYLGEQKRFGHWRDTHVRIEGPAVQGLQTAFLEDWYWAAGEIPTVNWDPLSCEAGGSATLILPTGPADAFDNCSLFFVQSLQSAQQRIWITSPYFVPDESVVAALQLAALRGVDVRIMLPDKPDKRLVWLAAFSYIPEVGQAGVKFYSYQNGFLHQKVMLIDSDLAAVGTANLDNRSLRLNFEMTVMVADPVFAQSVEAMLEKDFAVCKLVDINAVRQRAWPFRVAVAAARLLSPML